MLKYVHIYREKTKGDNLQYIVVAADALHDEDDDGLKLISIVTTAV